MPLRCLRRLALRGPFAVWLATASALSMLSLIVAAGILWLLDLAVWPVVLVSLVCLMGLAAPVGWLVARLACALEAAEHRARALSMSDPVTGLPNSRFLHQIGVQQTHQARRYSHPLTAVLFRLDALDLPPPQGIAGLPVDDPAREGLLRSAAARLRILVRESDIFCRLDDDSLILLLPETDADGATLMVDRLREGLAAAPGIDGQGLTARFGVAAMSRPDLTHLLDRARAALAEAKEAGAMVLAPPPVVEPTDVLVD